MEPKQIAERVHAETGFIIEDWIDEDGNEFSTITDNDGGEHDLGEFEKRLARYL